MPAILLILFFILVLCLVVWPVQWAAGIIITDLEKTMHTSLMIEGKPVAMIEPRLLAVFKIFSLINSHN